MVRAVVSGPASDAGRGTRPDCDPGVDSSYHGKLKTAVELGSGACVLKRSWHPRCKFGLEFREVSSIVHDHHLPIDDGLSMGFPGCRQCERTV
jgi:hypothetical protein